MKINTFFKSIAVLICLTAFVYAQTPTPGVVGEMVEPEKIEGNLKTAKWSSKDTEMAAPALTTVTLLKGSSE